MRYLNAWVRHFDKLLHALGGTVVYTACSPAGPAFASSAVVAVAAAKEEYDRRRPDRHTYDGWDAYATVVGIPVAEVIQALLPWP